MESTTALFVILDTSNISHCSYKNHGCKMYLIYSISELFEVANSTVVCTLDSFEFECKLVQIAKLKSMTYFYRLASVFSSFFFTRMNKSVSG